MNMTEMMRLLNEDDVVALAWVSALFRKKMAPFLEQHKHHYPELCLYADPYWLETVESLAWHLDVMVEAFNAMRIDNGKEPIKTFADAAALNGGKFDA